MFSRSRFLLSGAFVWALLLSISSLEAQEQVVDRNGGYSFVVPPGFVNVLEQAKTANFNFEHAYQYVDPHDSERNVMLMITKLGGTIGRERLDTKMIPPGKTGRFFVTQWQGYDIDVLETQEQAQGVTQLGYVAQVPIKRGAMNVALLTAPSNKAELDRLLPIVLNNFQGETNWDDTPLSKLFPNISRKTLDLVGILLMIVSGLAVAYCLFRQQFPIAILVLGGINIFLCTFWSVPQQSFSRITLAMMILGAAAITLGVFLNVKLKNLAKLPRQDASS